MTVARIDTATALLLALAGCAPCPPPPPFACPAGYALTVATDTWAGTVHDCAYHYACDLVITQPHGTVLSLPRVTAKAIEAVPVAPEAGSAR